jgi:hypothetical protein
MLLLLMSLCCVAASDMVAKTSATVREVNAEELAVAIESTEVGRSSFVHQLRAIHLSPYAALDRTLLRAGE